MKLKNGDLLRKFHLFYVESRIKYDMFCMSYVYMGSLFLGNLVVEKVLNSEILASAVTGQIARLT